MGKHKPNTHFNGKGLRTAMAELGYTPRQLHRLLLKKNIDVSTQSVYNWMNGTIPDSAYHIQELCNILGILNEGMIIPKKVKRDRATSPTN